MRILIKRAKILDPHSRHNNKRVDIFIRNGRIERIARGIKEKADAVIEQDNLHVSPGWIDIGTQVGEPGFEHREDLQSVSQAAIAGGFTHLVCFPNTDPAIQSKSEVEYIRSRSTTLPITISPCGAVSRGCAGKDLAEMQDMDHAGAVAFTDGRYPIDDSALMLRALQYVKTFDSVVINRPFDRQLAAGGQIHESRMSAMLGMKGIPELAERIALERDLRLLEYTSSRLLVHGVSAAGSIPLVSNARKSGMRISATVPALNLLVSDDDLAEFDTNLKVMPPLRGESDRKALLKGLIDGTISCICSNHEPLEEELKKLEFARADFGATGLETAFAIANTALQGRLKIEEIVRCLTEGPADALGLPRTKITQGNATDLTLFDPDAEWTVTRKSLKSRSKNAATLGKELKGKVFGVISKGVYHSAGV
jgi:dihydroorotase